MRLEEISINGFRGFGAERTIKLAADAVIVFGANGRGKTSLFDAVLWALTGSVPRLPGDDGAVVSKYSETGEARVELTLRESPDTVWRVTRRFDGAEQHVVLDLPTGREEGSEAKLSLQKRLWPDSMFTADGAKALTTALTRSVYLQQDVVREFIDSAPDDAFRTISELIGTGRITELQTQLERSKAAWTRVTNERAQELAALRDALEELGEQLSGESTTAEGDALEERWGTWWARVRVFASPQGRTPTLGSADAASALNATIKQLQAERLSVERRRDMAARLLHDIEAHQPSTADPKPLLEALDAARKQLESDRATLAEAEKHASEVRKAAVERRSAAEELRTLAALALRHLESACPVCGQQFDRDATRARLEGLVTAMADAGTTDAATEEVRRVAGVVEAREKQCADLAARHGAAQDSSRREELWRSQLAERLQELGVNPAADADTRTAVSSRKSEAEKELAELAALQHEGESLALAAARAAEAARRAEIEDQVRNLQKQVEALDRDVRERTATGELAQGLLDGLREAGADIVRTRLEGLSPLLQRLYETIDPHPSFKAVRMLSRPMRGRGKVITSIADAEKQVSSETPGAVLSSSQMNALAVSAFLALNLAASTMPLDVMLLDDPLQALDEINLLGLVDLLRRVRDRRQIIVSTHDVRWARLLERKLRPVGEFARVRFVELQSWTREGPHVVQGDVPGDRTGLRVVA